VAAHPPWCEVDVWSVNGKACKVGAMRGVCRARCVFCAHDNGRVAAAYVQMGVCVVCDYCREVFLCGLVGFE